ncbi:unnamed protein product [Bemisia tabaci]|uniref:Uncharacterized protein n=1 Tax=Bemisia tabaci TaxID=7038 RepID=A0A9P0AEQ3_BEMTA|nr:unnamed protein product [Bemisia tabaci]
MNGRLLKDACATSVTIDARPFTIVQDVGFRLVFDPILEALPAAKKFAISADTVREFIRPKAQKLKAKLKKELNGRVLSLKVDRVSRLNRCFLGVNVQYIENGQVCIRTLGVPELTGRHTGENLRDVIIEVSEEYDINIKKVYTSTTNNGSSS